MAPKRLFALLTLLFTACGTAYRSELYKAETLMLEHPDSSLNILEEIRIDRIRGRKNRAKYALLYSQALDKNYIDVENDSIIRVARDYYAHRGSNEERAQAFYYYGIVANNAGDIDEAMKAFVPARIYAEKTDNEYIKGLIYSAIGNLYYDQNSLTEAIEQFDKAEESFIKTNQQMNQLITAYRKGNIYRMLNKDTIALNNLQYAEAIAHQLNDTILIVNINLSITICKIHNSNDKSFIIQQKNSLFNIYRQFNGDTIPISHYMPIGQIYFKIGNTDSTRYYLNKYLETNQGSQSDNIGIYATLSQNEKRENNYKKALEYREQYNILSDSLIKVQNDNLIEKLDQKYKTQYLQRSYEVLEAKHKLQKLVNSLILILVAIVGGILICLYRYIAARKNQKIEEYRQYIEEVDANYENLTLKYKNLKDLAAAKGARADKLLELLGRRIDSLKTLCDISITSVLPNTFKERFTAYINLESKGNKYTAGDLVALADMMYDNVVTRLAEKFEFTDHEKTFCACAFLDFTKEEIRVLFNHSNISSIYNTRCKIGNKMGLKGSSLDIVKYMMAIRDNPEYIDNNQLLISKMQSKK